MKKYIKSIRISTNINEIIIDTKIFFKIFNHPNANARIMWSALFKDIHRYDSPLLWSTLYSGSTNNIDHAVFKINEWYEKYNTQLEDNTAEIAAVSIEVVITYDETTTMTHIYEKDWIHSKEDIRSYAYKNMTSEITKDDPPNSILITDQGHILTNIPYKYDNKIKKLNI